MSADELTQLAHQVYAGHRRSGALLPLDARFYPYANLNHTIRLRRGRIHLRISDVMQGAPIWALQCITAILLLKLDRRKVRPELERAYREYAESPEVRESISQIRRTRGRKIVSDPAGRFFDLQVTFDELNRRYFQGRLQVSVLAWSRRRNRHILGHYDRCHDTIVISRSLDAARVPPLLFEFILFHEMLHAHVGDQRRNGKRYSHHQEFKVQEKKFDQYREAQELMKRFSVRVQ